MKAIGATPPFRHYVARDSICGPFSLLYRDKQKTRSSKENNALMLLCGKFARWWRRVKCVGWSTVQRRVQRIIWAEPSILCQQGRTMSSALKKAEKKKQTRWIYRRGKTHRLVIKRKSAREINNERARDPAIFTSARFQLYKFSRSPKCWWWAATAAAKESNELFDDEQLVLRILYL